MERIQLTPPGTSNVRGSRARLYIRWMPHLGAGAVALYELLRTLPDVGLDAVTPKSWPSCCVLPRRTSGNGSPPSLQPGS